MDRRNFVLSAAAATAGAVIGFPAIAGSKNGSFKGQSNHVTKGSVSVSGNKIKLQDSFWFDGAPDPRVALGKNGKFISGTDFAVLKKNAGAQSYSIPANLQGTEFDTVVIWCRKFSVPLGYAQLN